MALYDLAFVDSITASPAVRLDLRGAQYNVRDTTTFGLPELRRAVATTMLADGDTYPAAAYGNRIITLVVQMRGADDDARALAMQALLRELDRPTNILMYRPGTTAPVFFRTFRTPPDAVVWDPFEKALTASIPAGPFAAGLKETLGTFTVFNDPATPGPDLNSNPYFETDANSWTPLGGTIARSTAQFHQGSASLLLTPDGVAGAAQARAELVPVVGGRDYRPSAWVRCAVARSVRVSVDWHNSVGVLLSTTNNDVAVSAGTWTLNDSLMTAPAGAAQARLIVQLTSTPPSSNTLHIDEARLQLVGGGNGMYADLTGIKGDVEAPLRIRVPLSGALTAGGMSVLAVRRRGTPSQGMFFLQAEAMAQGTDTSTQSGAEDVSGGPTGNRWSRTTFTTSPASPAVRLSLGPWPSLANPDIRGRYRVFARVRTTVAMDLIYARLRWGLSGLLSAGNEEATVGYDGTAGYAGWKLVDLGLISFPAAGDPGVDGLSGVPLNVTGQTIAIEARRQSGSGNLDWDYLLFVPADDRLAIVKWGGIDLSGGSVVIDATTGTVYPVDSTGTVYGGGLQPSPTGWIYASPGVTNRLFWLRSAGPYGADAMSGVSTDLTIDYWPRYLFVRPPTS